MHSNSLSFDRTRSPRRLTKKRQLLRSSSRVDSALMISNARRRRISFAEVQITPTLECNGERLPDRTGTRTGRDRWAKPNGWPRQARGRRPRSLRLARVPETLLSITIHPSAAALERVASSSGTYWWRRVQARRQPRRIGLGRHYLVERHPAAFKGEGAARHVDAPDAIALDAGERNRRIAGRLEPLHPAQQGLAIRPRRSSFAARPTSRRCRSRSCPVAPGLKSATPAPLSAILRSA